MEQGKEVVIRQKVRKGMDGFINSVKNVEIQEILRKSSFVAGGAIASFIRDEEPNDYDFYINNVNDCYKVARYFLNQMEANDCEIVKGADGVNIQVPHGIFKKDKEDGVKYQPLVVTANAISFSDGVQIVTRFSDVPEKIVDQFDFLHTRGIYDYNADVLLVSPETEKAIEEKRVVYTGSLYPLASMIRTRKFMKRGWRINAGQFLKISIQISTLDLQDPVVLKQQLVGVDLLHFAHFLQVLEEKKYNELMIDESFDKVFELIDASFEKNEEEGITEEEFPN